jgi:hypothetical protein
MFRRSPWFLLAVSLFPASGAAQRPDSLAGHYARVAYHCDAGTWRPGYCRKEGIIRTAAGDSLRLMLGARR